MIEALVGPVIALQMGMAGLKQSGDSMGTLRRSPDIRQFLTGDKPLDLQGAVSLGLRLSPTLAQAGAKLRFVLGQSQVVLSGYLPKVSVTPGAQDIERIVTQAYAIQATVPVDISGLLQAAKGQSRFDEVAARLDVNRARNDVVYRVENAYYEALRSQALVRVAQDNVLDSEARVNDARARYQARVVAYIDVVRAETDLADAQRRLIDAQSSVTEALANLAQAIGVDVTGNLRIAPLKLAEQPDSALKLAPKIQMPSEVAGQRPSPVLTPALPTPTDQQSGPVQATMSLGPEFRATLQEAEVTRPEVLAEQARLAAAQKGIDLARSSVLPSLVLGFGYYDLRSQTGGRVNEPQAFVGLNIPLYDAGLARGRTAEARALVDQAQTSERLARDQVDRNVQSAFLASVRARDELSVAQQALKAAQLAYDLAKVRYQTGVSSHAGISPLIELSDAQVALTLASQNLVNAEYDTAEAKLAIDYSVGRFAFVKPSLGLGELSDPPKS